VSPHRRPGWLLSNGHLVRSNAEAALCAYLLEMNFAHTHWSLNFNLPIGTDQLRLYIPSLTLDGLTDDGRTLIIEPIDSVAPGSGLRRLQALRHVHAAEYSVIVIARRPLHGRIPRDAYDHLFPLEDFVPLLTHLRGLL
jgi:hypothetical protein